VSKTHPLAGETAMLWSVNIGSIAGTAIKIHITFLMFLVWIFVAGWASGAAEAAMASLIFMVLLFACVLAHEFGHIFTARAFGVATPDVILLPIGGVARLERISEKPSEEFLIAIAGPLVNVVIALVLMVGVRANLDAHSLAVVESTSVSLVDRLAEVNLFLALFNLIPAFPMDGGRVLRALLATRLGHVRATEVAASIGQLCAFALGFLGLFYNPLLIFIAIFVYLAASSEAQLVSLRAMSRDVPVSNAMMTEFATLTPDEHIDAAVQTLLRTSQSEFSVVDGDHRLVGLLCRHPRPQGTRARRQGRPGDGHGNPDHRKPAPARRGVPPAPGKVGARRRGGRRCRPPGRPRDLGDDPANAAGEGRPAQGRAARPVEPAGRGLRACGRRGTRRRGQPFSVPGTAASLSTQSSAERRQICRFGENAARWVIVPMRSE
jgi:stage IV sporulation protein FB